MEPRSPIPQPRGRAPWSCCISAALLALIALSTQPASAQMRSGNCAGCHAGNARQIAESVHHDRVRCQECHGGQNVYELTPADWNRFAASTSAPATQRGSFDHGPTFRGKPARVDVPVLCGTCHADVEK